LVARPPTRGQFPASCERSACPTLMIASLPSDRRQTRAPQTLLWLPIRQKPRKKARREFHAPASPSVFFRRTLWRDSPLQRPRQARASSVQSQLPVNRSGQELLKSLVSVAVKQHPWAQSSDQTTISAGTGCLARAKWRRDTQIGAEFVTTAE
jgi:hypothetical protein